MHTLAGVRVHYFLGETFYQYELMQQWEQWVLSCHFQKHHKQIPFFATPVLQLYS